MRKVSVFCPDFLSVSFMEVSNFGVDRHSG